MLGPRHVHLGNVRSFDKVLDQLLNLMTNQKISSPYIVT